MRCGNPEWRNFQFTPNNHYRFFFLHTVPLTTACRLEYVLLYQFRTRITTFLSKKSSVGLLSKKLTSKCSAQNDVKMMLKSTSWCHAWGRLTPTHIRRKYQEWVKIAENPVGYARNFFLAYPTRYSVIFTRSGYFHLTRGGVRRPHIWRHNVIDGCWTEHVLIENVVFSA